MFIALKKVAGFWGTQRKKRLALSFASLAVVMAAMAPESAISRIAGLNTPGRPAIVRLSPTVVRVIIDTNGNTVSTRYAVEDAVTNQFVQIYDPATKISVLGETPVFQTYAQWNGDAGFLVGVNANTEYRFRALAKSGA